MRQALRTGFASAAFRPIIPTNGMPRFLSKRRRSRQARPSKNSFILAKKPELSGWVVFDDSDANSVRSSR